MKLDGSQIEAGDEIYPYNARKDEPALRVQLVSPPEQYQGKWFNAEAANLAARPEITDHMCKSYYDNPQQARNFSEDGASCRACPFNPFTKGPMPGTNQAKCNWRGDLQLRIVPDSGILTGEETIWTLTLSTTSMIQFRGSSRDPVNGAAADTFNFMFKLSKFAEEQAEEWGVTPEQAVMIALTAYQAGGVFADIRLPRMQNDDKSRSWTVIDFTPVYVERSFADPAQPEETDTVEEPVPAIEPKVVSGEVIDKEFDPLPF